MSNKEDWEEIEKWNRENKIVKNHHQKKGNFM
jgi:hypothetical protein